MRGWTWLDDDNELAEAQIDRVTPLLDQLAAQWSELHSAEERRGWDRQARYEMGEDDGPEYDSEEEAEAERFAEREMRKLRVSQHEAQLSAIEEAMARHGARIMRPYEHWNEDEGYMQYMESDRYGEGY